MKHPILMLALLATGKLGEGTTVIVMPAASSPSN
jgi:hypothetical protein